MNVLSLFDGASCGQVALERSGIMVNNYLASEIDKPAIKVTQYHYPDTQQIGDITKLTVGNILKIHLVIGGSPCQSFSRSGDGTGFDGKSGLFWEYVRVLKEVQKYNPDVKFLLENVSMKKEWENIITEALGVEPIKIDSKLVSAQKRQRLYWTNIDVDTEIENKNILLSDIVKGPRKIINDHEVVIERIGNSFKVRNATKQGYLIANEGDSVNLEVPKSKTRRGRVGIGKTNTLNTACNYGMVLNGNLVELETNDYEKLQTMDLDYTNVDGVSNRQRKNIIGNGWTIDVIAHIFKKLK